MTQARRAPRETSVSPIATENTLTLAAALSVLGIAIHGRKCTMTYDDPETFAAQLLGGGAPISALVAV